MKNLAKLALVLALAAVSFAAAAPGAEAACPFRDIICTTQYDPVICLNGKVYSNQCVALRNCAVGCVPYDPPA